MKRERIFCCRGLIALSVLGILLTGCSFRIAVPVLEDEVLPSLPVFVMNSKITLKDQVEEKIEIGPTSLGEICGFGDLEQFQETILTEAQEYISGLPLSLLDKITVTGIFLEKMAFTASTGDFSSLERIIVEIQQPAAASAIFIAENTGDFGQTVELAADPPLDLVEASDGGCIEPLFTVKGSLPEQDVIFDLVMHLKVSYRLNLF